LRGRLITGTLAALVVTLPLSASNVTAASPVYRVDHVVDGDTAAALRDGQRVRLVQIDTPRPSSPMSVRSIAPPVECGGSISGGATYLLAFARSVAESHSGCCRAN
jgi:hypothetical protein